MAIGRVSSFGVHQSLLRDTTNTQLDLYRLQSQISSGVENQDFLGLRESTEQFADLGILRYKVHGFDRL